MFYNTEIWWRWFLHSFTAVFRISIRTLYNIWKTQTFLCIFVDKSCYMLIVNRFSLRDNLTVSHPNLWCLSKNWLYNLIILKTSYEIDNTIVGLCKLPLGDLLISYWNNTVCHEEISEIPLEVELIRPMLICPKKH